MDSDTPTLSGWPQRTQRRRRSSFSRLCKPSAPSPPPPAPAPLGGQAPGCPWADSQGPQLGHVVEAGHGDGADVVVVQGPDQGKPESLGVCAVGSYTGRGAGHLSENHSDSHTQIHGPPSRGATTGLDPGEWAHRRARDAELPSEKAPSWDSGDKAAATDSQVGTGR